MLCEAQPAHGRKFIRDRFAEQVCHFAQSERKKYLFRYLLAFHRGMVRPPDSRRILCNEAGLQRGQS